MRDVKDPQVRRKEIMEASLDLFTEKGYMKTRTQDIVDRLQISRGLLYYHFKNKEDILYHLIEYYFQPTLKKLEKIAQDENLDATEKLKTFFEATIIDSSNPSKEKIVLYETINMEDNRYLIDRFSYQLLGITSHYLANIFKQGNQEKVFSVDQPEKLAHLLMSAYIFTSNETSYSESEMLEYLKTFQSMVNKLLEVTIF